MAMFNTSLAPTSGSLQTLYTATADTVISSIIVCNRSTTPTSFRVALRPLGISIRDNHYLYYDQLIDGNSTFIATIGATMIRTDKLDVYATLDTLSFNVFGEVL